MTAVHTPGCSGDMWCPNCCPECKERCDGCFNVLIGGERDDPPFRCDTALPARASRGGGDD